MLTVVHGDGPADAKAGLAEALLSSSLLSEEGHVLHGVSVAITSEWRQEPLVDVRLCDPFDVLAREDSLPNLVARSSTDDSTWVSLALRGAVAAVTVATVVGDVLSSVDEMWAQAVKLCQCLETVGQPIRTIAVTLHFQQLRLSALHRPEAQHLVRAWESARTHDDREVDEQHGHSQVPVR